MPVQSDIKIVKLSLYPFRDGKIVKSGTLYSLADAAIVKNGVLYGFTGTANTLRSLSKMVREYPDILLTVVKTDRDTGDSVSRDMAVRLEDLEWIGVSGFENSEGKLLGNTDLSVPVHITVSNIGKQSFKVIGFDIVQGGEVKSSLADYGGVYEAGDSKGYWIDLSSCMDGEEITVKIYIQNV